MRSGMGINNPMFFVGVVENNDDPTGQGRVQVRAFGVHGENTEEEIQTGALPWAPCISGNYEPNNTPPKLNSFVFGMFLDGDEAQHPMVLGCFRRIDLNERVWRWWSGRRQWTAR